MVHKTIRLELEKHALPESYRAHIKDYVVPVAIEINQLKAHHGGALIIGIHGSQGSGKSTLANFLSLILLHDYGRKTVCLSLDDFYLTRAERASLADSVHPLLMTRGVPGTHDVTLMQSVLTDLQAADETSHTAIPRFDKAQDDRKHREDWDTVQGAVDIILLEGWCVAAQPEPEQSLLEPINALERNEDPSGVWRAWVNSQLAGAYQSVFSQVDYLIMLEAPSFECVAQWRGLQEQKLIASLEARGESATQTMDESGIQRFIQHYERITRRCLTVVPSISNCVLELDRDHKMVGATWRSTSPGNSLRLLVVTDLDGTLLDHHSYSYQAAIPALERLVDDRVPVVINTSKTLREVRDLSLELINSGLVLSGPCIIENGSAVVFPSDHADSSAQHVKKTGASSTKVFGARRADILETLAALRQEFGFRFAGFSDWTVAELVQHTGLSEANAVNAMARDYSEPLIWQDSKENYLVFVKELERRGLVTLKGGRFIHVQGQCDKGQAMLWLKQYLGTSESNTPCMVALGDSQNDVAMLSAADVAVVVRSPVHTPPELPPLSGEVIYTEQDGPAGWNESINMLLDRETV